MFLKCVSCLPSYISTVCTRCHGKIISWLPILLSELFPSVGKCLSASECVIVAVVLDVTLSARESERIRLLRLVEDCT